MTVKPPSKEQSEAFARMPRALAERNLKIRLDRLQEEIRQLPTVEKIKLAAEMLEYGVAPQLPIATLRLAVAELETALRLSGGRL